MVGVFIALDSHQQLLLSDFLIVASFVVSHCVCVCVCVCVINFWLCWIIVAAQARLWLW